MENLTSNLTDNIEGFIQEKVDLSKYETSFRRWLVCEIESGRMTWQESRAKFNLPHRFDKHYKLWQQKYAEEIVLTLPLMSAKERTDIQALGEDQGVREAVGTGPDEDCGRKYGYRYRREGLQA